jgi:hypothetical protein
MFEHCKNELLSKESLLRDWDDMLRIPKSGKMSIFRIGVESDRSPTQQSDHQRRTRNRSGRMAALINERLEFYLSCFPIGAQPSSYFQYGWGWTLSSGSLHDYPELHKPLGAPKGHFQRTKPKGWGFSREFTHASVWVNTESGQAKITWR